MTIVTMQSAACVCILRQNFPKVQNIVLRSFLSLLENRRLIRFSHIQQFIPPTPWELLGF